MSTVIKALDTNKSKITIYVNWNDKYPLDHHNDIVIVQLFKNGKKEDLEIELNKNNDWQYTWSNIEKNKYYELVEVKMNNGYDSKLICIQDDDSDEYTYQIIKTQHVGAISLTLFDCEANKGLSKEKIDIYDVNKHKVKEVVTDNNGKLFTDLPIGKYMLFNIKHKLQHEILIENDVILQKEIVVNRK